MRILYETNGLGFLGWIIDLPGAYIRGKTIGEARAKLDREITDYGAWLECPTLATAVPSGYEEIIKECGLHVEDADSDVTFDTELEDFNDTEDFGRWCDHMRRSGVAAQEVYDNCRHKDEIDPRMVRKTFYGDVYSTIQGQFGHIVDVQNYYLGQIGVRVELTNPLRASRERFVDRLREKYRSEGNKLYHYEEEDWTIKKIVRRIIWHDRIHTKAIERMEARLSGGAGR